MKVMVVGSGGREHAIIRALRKSPKVSKLFALPGNGGIGMDAENVPISATDICAIVKFAKENCIDFAAVIPDDPLVLGAADALREVGIPCFGPSKDAALIEGSKTFAKRLMQENGIPTAKCETFERVEPALEYVKKLAPPIVIKADGLALGKGVIIAQTVCEAEDAIKGMLSGERFGDSGKRILIEEYLEGEEISILSFTDGKTIVPMPSSMDHKRALDGDLGLNTGGMGAICPNPYYTPKVAEKTYNEIILPTINAMRACGRVFKGCLYFGLMLTEQGAKVIEYNCRFGDPETQAVLPLLESDLLEIMLAVENETLDSIDIRFSSSASCCVVLASGGYPEGYEKGKLIELNAEKGNELVFHAGTKCADGRLVTNGGRVLGVTAVGETLPQAIEEAYRIAGRIHFDGAYMRSDIGARALKAVCSEQS